MQNTQTKGKLKTTNKRLTSLAKNIRNMINKDNYKAVKQLLEDFK